MGLPRPASLSPSSISAFKQCPLAFRFSYVQRLPEPPSAATTKGTLVHRARLELLMTRPAPERTVAAALADLDTALAELADDPDLTELELTEAELADFHADAEKLVHRYFELEDPTHVQPIGLELKLEAHLDGVRLRGVIDRLELDENGDLVVTDYKTGSVPGEHYESKSLSGVHVYALLCLRTFGRLPSRVQLLYVSKPEAIIARPTTQTVGGVEQRAGAIMAAIETACARDSFRPNPSRLCDFCAFRAYCPAFGGNPVDAVELRGPGTVIAQPLPLAV